MALNNKNYHFCLTVLWVRNLDRAEHRGHVSTPQGPGTQLEDSKAGGWNPLKTNLLSCLVVDDISAERLAVNLGWNTHVCPLNMAWASSQYAGSPLRKQELCVRILMTKPQRYMLPLMLDPITWFCPKPHSRFKGREQI